MFNALISIFLKFLTKITDILFFPINAILVGLLPNDILSNITKITEFMNLPFQYIGWVFELVHIPSTALVMIVSYWVFKYGIVSSIAGVKKVITLYQRFKL